MHGSHFVNNQKVFQLTVCILNLPSFPTLSLKTALTSVNTMAIHPHIWPSSLPLPCLDLLCPVCYLMLLILPADCSVSPHLSVPTSHHYLQPELLQDSKLLGFLYHLLIRLQLLQTSKVHPSICHCFPWAPSVTLYGGF